MIRRFFDWIGGWYESWLLRTLIPDDAWDALLDDLDESDFDDSEEI